MNTANQQRKAFDLLAKPFQYPLMENREPLLNQVTLWICPTMTPCVAYSVGTLDGKSYLRRLIWNQRSENIASAPETYCTESIIDETVIKDITSAATNLPSAGLDTISIGGIDGVIYGFEIGHFPLSNRVSWWNSLPDQLQALAEFHSTYLLRLDSLLPDPKINIDSSLGIKAE